MSTVLVTGGAGFIGSHVAQTLMASGYDVIIVDVEAGKTERDSLALDNRKMIEDFGFTPMDIHAMVRRT